MRKNLALDAMGGVCCGHWSCMPATKKPRVGLVEYAKRPLPGVVAHLAEGIDAGHPWPASSGAVRLGVACGCPNRQSCRFVEHDGALFQPLSARYAKRPLRGVMRIWRRGGDSNPRGAINACLISSQVHSTALPPLRWSPAAGPGAQ